MTRTALIRNGLAELRLSSARQGAKAPFKPEERRERRQAPATEHKNKKNNETSKKF